MEALLVWYGYVLLFLGVAVEGEAFLLAAAGVLVLVVRHLRHAAWVEDLQFADAHRLVPLFIGGMGCINLLSAILPRLHQLIAMLSRWFPFAVAQHSRALMPMARIALLHVTGNLARRTRLAWMVAVLSLLVSLLTHITRALGLKSLKMAEEAVLDLREFGLTGGKRANLRAMVNKAAKSGIAVRRYDRAAALEPDVDEQLEEISDQWLAEKRLGKLGFTLGRFSLEAISGIPVFLATVEGRIQAFCSWLPYRNGTTVVLDLIRKRRDTVSGTMDFMIAHSLLELKAAGYLEASLANAPLANTSEPRGSLERGVALLFENMNPFSGYKNLFQFKKKFAPRWEGRHLVFPKGADLARVAYALASVHSAAPQRQRVFGR